MNGRNAGVRRVAVPYRCVVTQYYGTLLDIEIFNVWVREAPTYEDLPSWLDEAHSIENATFEASITKKLRESFGESFDKGGT